jgi:hypothetical protein
MVNDICGVVQRLDITYGNRCADPNGLVTTAWSDKILSRIGQQSQKRHDRAGR